MIEIPNKVCDLILVFYYLLADFFKVVENVLLGLKLCLNLSVELLEADFFDVVWEVAVQKQSLLEIRPLLNLLDVSIFLVVDLAPDLFNVEK